MADRKIISFDLKADFAFFKKPDINVGLQLSYNMLHKPALLGILGAIIGLEGYKRKGELPQYYQVLKEISVGIEPIEGFHERGNFQKTSVKYTNGVGYANADGNLLVEETMLIRPAFRCYLLLNTAEPIEAKLYDYISKDQCEYIPYLGKNEFQAWISAFQKWGGAPLKAQEAFSIDSIFIKGGSLRGEKVETDLAFAFDSPVSMGSFSYFERLPVGFDESLMQYQLGDFAFTDWKLKPTSTVSSLYGLTSGNLKKNIQLF
jgi:CRISPR-associated protein Cas5h